jgi:hypothetical protein
MSQPRRASRKKKVFLINFGDDYRTVIFGKTKFSLVCLVTFLPVSSRILLQIAQECGRSPLHTDCGPIHFSTHPEHFRGCQSCRYRYHYKFVTTRPFFIFLAGTRAFDFSHSFLPLPRVQRICRNLSLISRRRLMLSRGILKFAQKCSRSPLHTDCGISTSANRGNDRGR